MHQPTQLHIDICLSGAGRASTCESCLVTKRRQHANRQARKQRKTETLETQNRHFKMRLSEQTAELTLLQSVLEMLQQKSDHVSDQVLRQLQTRPSDVDAIQQLLNNQTSQILSELLLNHSVPQHAPQQAVLTPLPEPSPILITNPMAESATTTAPQCVILTPLVKPLAKPLAKRFVSESITPPPERTCSSPTSSDGAKRRKTTDIDTTSGTHADVPELVISSEPTANDDDAVASALLTLRTDRSAAAEVSRAFVPVAKRCRKRGLAEPKASPPAKAVQRPSALRYVSLDASRDSNYKYSTNIQRIKQDVNFELHTSSCMDPSYESIAM